MFGGITIEHFISSDTAMGRVSSLIVLILVVYSHQRTFRNIDIGSLGVDTDLLDYTVYVIEYLAYYHYGSFNCIFYDYEKVYPYDNLIGHVLKSPRLGHVAKFVINDRMPGEDFKKFSLYPSLMVFRVGRDWNWKYQFEFFHQHTKLLFLIDCKSRRCLEESTRDLAWRIKWGKFTKVVCLGSQYVAQLTLDAHWWPYYYYPDAAWLFYDVTWNLYGREVKYSWLFGEPYGDEMELMWLWETARHVNATLVPSPHNCPDDREVYLCYSQYFFAKQVHFGIKPTEWTNYEKLDFWIGSPIPITNSLLVPKGRKLDAFEYFLKPFTSKTWLAIIIVLVVTQLVHTLVPRAFRRDPMMVVIGNFGRLNSHPNGHVKKIAFNILILGYLFLLCSYETMIITFITIKPSLRTPKSLRDLQNSKIPIKVNLRRRPELANIPSIGNLVINYLARPTECDGSSAYLLEADRGYDTGYMPYDIYYGQTKGYSVLHHSIEMFVMAYTSMVRNPLRERFERTLIHFWETGLLTLWTEYHNHQNMKFYYRNETRYTEQNSSGPLSIYDLFPVYVALGVGLSVAGAVFILEIIIYLLP